MATKSAFLAAYRAAILANASYPWARDESRLDRFMQAVEATLRGPTAPWNKDSEIARKVWRDIGCKGPMTYKALKALPEGLAS